MACEAIANGFTVEGFVKTHCDRRLRPADDDSLSRRKVLQLSGRRQQARQGILSFFAFGQGKFGKTSMPEVAITEKNFADGQWHYFAARFQKDGEPAGSRLTADVVDEAGRHFSGSTDAGDGFKIACSARPLLMDVNNTSSSRSRSPL